jgi:hypothetical protein
MLLAFSPTNWLLGDGARALIKQMIAPAGFGLVPEASGPAAHDWQSDNPGRAQSNRHEADAS